MKSLVQTALDCLRGLGSVEEMRRLGEKSSIGWVRNNSHIHLPPNFSAFENVEQAVRLAAGQQVTVVGLSNYYDFEVYGDFFQLGREHRIFPVFGLEVICLIDELVKAGVKVNDPGNPGKMYLCGKGITRFGDLTQKAQQIIAAIRGNDTERMGKMIDLLTKVFEGKGVAAGLTAQKVVEQVCRRHGCSKERVTLQERHVAKAFQEAFFSLVPGPRRGKLLGEIFGVESKAGPEDEVKIQNEIRSHLMKAGKAGFVQETFLDFEQAYSLILELGGIPCYPTLADGASPICLYEEPVEKLIADLKKRKVYFAEYIPIRNQPQVLLHYVKTMRQAGIPVSGGTEHNTLDLLGIEPTCLNKIPVPEDIKAIFWEGACVAAGHQFLTLHGQCGFVDNKGNPNPAYTTEEERIGAFAKIGAAVIRKYQQG
ncbi:MAG: hypothetical protein WC975_09030 [Phycisphaerae bacterium]